MNENKYEEKMADFAGAILEWASAMAKARRLEEEIKAIAQELELTTYEQPTAYGKAIVRRSGRGKYDWKAIADSVRDAVFAASDDDSVVAEFAAAQLQHTTYETDWQAVARAVAPSEDALNAAVAEHTKPVHVDWKAVVKMLKDNGHAALVDEFTKRFYTPPKWKWVVDLKPYGGK